MPEAQVSEKAIRHRLASWYAHEIELGLHLAEPLQAAGYARRRIRGARRAALIAAALGLAACT
jgi:hypothetical protein